MFSRLKCASIVVLLAAAVPIRAETRLIFPRVVLQQGVFSGLAIANPTLGSATITLRAYQPNGSLFAGAGVTNPSSTTLAVGEQYVALAKQIFNPPASISEAATPTRLWVEVTSPTDGLTGFSLDGDDRQDYMDGSDVGAPGIALILPLVENSPPVTTEIALVNPNEDKAEVSIEFLRADGTGASAVQSRTIPSRGGLLGPLSTLFPTASGDVAALVLLSDRPVICFGYLLRSSDNSLITVPAQSTAFAAKTLYFPQLAEGDSWATTVGVVNTTSNDETVTLTAYTAAGEVFAAAGITNPVSRVIKGRGVLRETARKLFGFPPSPLQQGWIKVEGVHAALYGYVEYGAGTNRALVSAQLKASTRAMFSYVALQDKYFTGLAVLNPSSAPTNLEVVFLGRKGNSVAKHQRVLKTGERQSRLLTGPDGWFPNLPAGIVDGALFVKSDNAVIATELFGTSDLAVLANVPPQRVTTSFDPAAQMPTIQIIPPVAVLETGKSQKFSASGLAGLSWYVDEAPGGNAALGTVAADGTYRAPATAPDRRNVSISARNAAGDQSGGASISLVQREVVAGGLASVTAVAYFENSERFFIAEQQVLGSPEGGERRDATTNARILEQKADGTRTEYLSIAGDSLGKMLPYVDSKQQNWLLVAGTTSGKVYRINLETKQLTTIAEGLNKPNSMVLDSSGNLLVAAENAVELIPRSSFDSAPGSARLASQRSAFAADKRTAIDVQSPRGVAVDSCSGAIYVTTADGTLWEYIGQTRRDVLGGVRLTDPNEILVINQEWSQCPRAAVLLVCERDAVSLVIPWLSLRNKFQFLPYADSRDLEFFAEGNPFSRNREPSIGIAGENEVLAVGVPGQYSESDTSPGQGRDLWKVPHLDPEGDTFEYESAAWGYDVPDIVAVDAVDLDDSVAIAVVFSGPVVPVADGAARGADILIELDVDANYFTGDRSVLNDWSFFGETFLGVDWWIKSYTSTITEFTTRREYPIDTVYLGDTIVMVIPKSVVDLSSSLLALAAGNWVEGTDIAPNGLHLDLRLLDPTQAGGSARRVAAATERLRVDRRAPPLRSLTRRVLASRESDGSR